jgi:vancomycin aglycone glucosyltransferase
MERIVIGAVGTKGDARPAIALGEMLSEGREVTLVAPPENREAAERATLRFLPLGEDFTKVVARGDLGNYREQIGLQFSEYRDEYARADAIIGFSLFFAGASLAQAAGRPYSQVYYTPQVFRSRLIGPPSSKRARASPLANALAWWSHEAQDDFVLKAVINEGRASLGLGPIRHVSEARGSGSPILAVDSGLASPPADVSGVRQAHYWSLDEGRELDETTRHFVEGGSPPLLICLGSVSRAVRDSRALLQGAATSLCAAGARVILVHPDAAESPFERGPILEARSLPFDTLLPRCSAIAHHGGIGTLFAAARAGIPQCVLPCMLDQYYWAERVRNLGLGRAEKGPRALAEEGFARRFIGLAKDEVTRAAAREAAARLSSPERALAMRARVGELFSRDRGCIRA